MQSSSAFFSVVYEMSRVNELIYQLPALSSKNSYVRGLSSSDLISASVSFGEALGVPSVASHT